MSSSEQANCTLPVGGDLLCRRPLPPLVSVRGAPRILVELTAACVVQVVHGVKVGAPGNDSGGAG